MCNRSNNINNSYNINQNTCYPTSRENILLERLPKYQEKDKKDFNESLTSFNIDCNNNLDRPLKTAFTKYGIISLEDITIQDENNHPNEYDFKKIGQPVLGIFVAQNSKGSSKLKKNRLKRKFRRQYRTDIPGIMKRDASEMTESNNEKLNNYYPANYSSLNDGLASVSKMKLSKNRHHCNTPSCPLNIHNNDSLIEKNLENYSNLEEYSFKSIPYENCTNYSYSQLVEKYPENFDWISNENVASSSNVHACCCLEKRETCFQECPPSKASLFVETGESMIKFSTSWSSNSYLPANVCPCSNESSMIEEHSTMKTEDVERDDGPFEKEEHAMIDKCGARCKSRDFKHEPCCSHFTSKKHSSIENSTWSQLEMVESKARRLDYGRRENIRWRDVGTSSNVRSVTKRPRYSESQTDDNTSERHRIPKNYENSLFGNFEIGKVWSRVHDTCKNFVQSAITNIGQTIKNISRSKDTTEDKENEISDYLSRNSKVLADKKYSNSCQEREYI